MTQPSLTRPCPRCGLGTHVSYNVNWGLNFHHDDSGTIACGDGGYPADHDPSPEQCSEYIRLHPDCGQRRAYIPPARPATTEPTEAIR